MGIVRATATAMLREISPDLADSAAISFAFAEIASNIAVDVKSEVYSFLHQEDNYSLCLLENSEVTTSLRFSKTLGKFCISTEYKNMENFIRDNNEIALGTPSTISFVEANALINIKCWADFVKRRLASSDSELLRLQCLTQAY